MDFQAWRLIVASIALRTILLLLGSVDVLQWRVEVSTPANSLQSLREGLHLDDLGISPYAGSQCCTQPLALWLNHWTANSAYLYAVPNIVLDVVAGFALRVIAVCLPSGPEVSQYTSPNTVMGLYLLNPFTMASCIAGVTTTLENTSCILALLAAMHGKWLATAALLAFATYMDLHCILLAVPAALLLVHGPEAQGSSSSEEKSVQHICNIPQQESNVTDPTTGCSNASISDIPQKNRRDASVYEPLHVSNQHGKHAVSACLRLLIMTSLCFLGLAVISDVVVQKHEGAVCLTPNLSQIVSHQFSREIPSSKQVQQGTDYVNKGECPAGAMPGVSSCPTLGSTSQQHSRQRCWAVAVYGLHVFVEDQTPNIGQSWYFFTEMFAAYLPFFRFVIHSLSVVLTIPMAIRFPRRPVLLFVLQCLINCMFKPYPSVADHALYLGLLPLLGAQLAILKTGMLLVVSYLLLAVLEHSMWHQWINIESANSNFYYSISLLIGAWQTFLVVQLLLLTVMIDREKKHKTADTTECKPFKSCIFQRA